MAKALVVAAPSSGCGKTVITLGLLRALRHRGLRVASAKVGPDYIDPRFHEAATGRPCFNLDPWARDKAQIRTLLRSLSGDADIIVIEGVMGLFDGPDGAAGSTADLASSLGLPVILAVDARHQAQSVAALVHGFSTFRPDVTVAGVLLNRVSSDRHAAVLHGALGHRVLGTLRHDDSLVLPSRHLGLVQAEENQDLETFIETAALAVARETVLDRILEIAGQLVGESVIREALPPLGQRIAIARDAAFAFAYPHLLHQWHRSGASLSFFSPLANEPAEPDADAIFLPGGYPELHAARLSANAAFLAGLRMSKGLIYGECGGYMVLGEALVDARGTSHAMAGLLPVVTSFANRKLHLGYRQLTPEPGAPWSSPLRGHEFHYSSIVQEGAADRLFSARDAAGRDLAPMGLRRGKVMGSYAHAICEAH
ncbi:MAG: cobyrinate a,c-diamide synthase [Aestuariivirga sp.]